MFKKYKLKHRIRAFLVMVFAVAFMAAVLWAVFGQPAKDVGLNLVGKIVLLTLWGIFSLITFLGGLMAFINSSDPLEDYLAESGVTEEELQKESETAQRFPTMLIGDRHIFVIAKNNFLVFPIENLEGLTIRSYGGASCQNVQDLKQVGGKMAAAVVFQAATGMNGARGKRRVGYYYMYFHGKNIPDGSKLYFALWPSMAKVIAALEQAKPGLNVKYQ